MTNPLRGLRLSVYRSADGMDATNKGITSRVTDLTLVGVMDAANGETTMQRLPAKSQVTEPHDDAPAVVLVSRNIGLGARDGRTVWYLKPLELLIDPFTPGAGGRHSMMGGNFAHTSDSRFAALTGVYAAVPVWDAIPVHDRIEGR